MGKKAGRSFRNLRQTYTEQGDKDALHQARELVSAQANLSQPQREQLLGYLEGRGAAILPEPAALLTETAKLPGLDGQKMSKSYSNTIAMRDDPKRVERAIRVMPTDPARVRLSDPGDPEKCPVWGLHQVYSDEETKAWVQQGCKAAAFGCLECKKPLIDKVLEEQAMIRERARPYEENPALVKEVVANGEVRARKAAKETMEIVRESVGTVYR